MEDLIKYSNMNLAVKKPQMISENKRIKRSEAIKCVFGEIGKKTRENERRAAKSLEYARRTIVK